MLLCTKHNREYKYECTACTFEDMQEVAKAPVAPRLHHLQDGEVVVKAAALAEVIADLNELADREELITIIRKDGGGVGSIIYKLENLKRGTYG